MFNLFYIVFPNSQKMNSVKIKIIEGRLIMDQKLLLH